MKYCKFQLLTALLISLLTGCGGGGPDSADSDPVTPPVIPALGTAGIFDVNYGQFSGVYTLLDNGQFYGLHFVSGNVLAGHPRGLLSASNSTSVLESIAWANFIDDQNQVGAQEPAGIFGRTFTASALNVKISGSMGTFTASTNRQKPYFAESNKSLYLDPIPLSTIAGVYSGTMRSAGIGLPQQTVSAFSISDTGTLSGNAVGCDFSGSLVPHGNTGIFDVQVLVSGEACPLSPNLRGIVTPLAFANNTPTLALQLNSDDMAQTTVFVVTKN